MSAEPPLRRHTRVPSPIGELLLVAEDEALCGLYMDLERGWMPRVEIGPRDDAALAEARHQLDEYFAGERQVFDLAIRLRGTTFQRQVWEALMEIPYGETRSYGEQARRIGAPDAPRAVGAANGQNPVSIIVPCHRVIGANGALTGYGGGIERKRWLLAHEAQQRTLL
ncbi:MAG: methylated-DNA--[protein]-cysteine S-methyltransferase [Panacagrimonas sp.]